MSAPESTLTKVRRLPIRILQHDTTSTIADVTGDHDTYRVNVVRGVDNEPLWCSCPCQGEVCSHVLALALWVKEQR